MFDLDAFEAAVGAWGSGVGRCDCMGVWQEYTEASGLLDDAVKEIRRLRAEVTELRAKDKARRLSDAGDRRDWDACDAIEAEAQPSRARGARSVKVPGPPRVLTADDLGPPECVEDGDDEGGEA